MDQDVAPVELTEEEIRTFVGPRAEYYIRAWGKTSGGYNRAAFFLSGLWIVFRKMYGVAAIIAVAVILESIAEDLIFIGWLGHSAVPRPVERAVTFALAVICGSFGNRWYLSHARRIVAEERANVRSGVGYLDRLAARGGTSLVRAFLCLVVFAVAIVLSAVATQLFMEATGMVAAEP